MAHYSTIYNFLKLTRLPFLSATVIPYFIGASYVFRATGQAVFNAPFFIGLFAVICANIAANIFNDYFDSKSGCDWHDTNDHFLFGGSKVIQKGLLSEKAVYKAGIMFILLSGLSVVWLQMILRDIPIIPFGALILYLAVSYSAPPLKLSYIGLGEATIFILCGSAIVAGSYTIVTGRLFSMDVLFLSLPISFLVTAILYCNEVPDYPADKHAGKKNLVVRMGPKKAYWGYAALVGLGFLSIILCVLLKILPARSLFLLFVVLLYIKPVFLIKERYRDLEKLKTASRLTITGHTLVGLGLIWALIT